MSKVDPAIMELGQQAYITCFGCHQANGEGMANLAPPLANSEWVTGPAENLIRMMFRGIQGPIEVNGQQWNLLMTPNSPILQTDEKIAAVLTYVRNSWGNEASVITPEEVAKWRKEEGQPMLTVADLIDPKSVKKEETTAHHEPHTEKHDAHAEEVHADEEAPTEASQAEVKEEIGTPAPTALKDYSSGIPFGGLLFGGWVILCFIPVIIGANITKK